MAADANVSPEDEKVFRTLDAYPWNADEEYQHGLQAILGTNPNPQQAQHLTLRARCFYYARKFKMPVDFASYQAWHDSQAKHDGYHSDKQSSVEAQQIGSPEEKPPYPLSFDAIVELITTGKPVPGIKAIPNTILEGQSSGSTASSRKKPWEA